MTIAINVVVVLFCMSGPVHAGEQVSLTDLPADVPAAIQREQAVGSEIKNVAAEKGNGKTSRDGCRVNRALGYTLAYAHRPEFSLSRRDSKRGRVTFQGGFR